MPTLKHFIQSSLPPARKLSNGKFVVPHFDAKQTALEWTEAHAPELVAKTTTLWMGWYSSNMKNFPNQRAIPVVRNSSFHVLLWKLPVAD